MPATDLPEILKKKIQLSSRFLLRKVTIDLYLPVVNQALDAVLLINDGQDLEKMPFTDIISAINGEQRFKAVCFAGIHAGAERRLEYGTAASPDYLGRGNKADAYSRFVTEELVAWLLTQLPLKPVAEWGIAGFSLGGLSALDIGWHFPAQFSTIGVFSGSLWWRSVDAGDPLYSDEQHRLMHAAIRKGSYKAGQRFFFECGTEDETEDRNQNGIIDSIDDTRDLIAELESLGEYDIHYLEIEGGKHDVKTWAKAFPFFLQWAWGDASAVTAGGENKNAAR